MIGLGRNTHLSVTDHASEELPAHAKEELSESQADSIPITEESAPLFEEAYGESSLCQETYRCCFCARPVHEFFRVNFLHSPSS